MIIIAPRFFPFRAEKGSVLILALWALAFLAFFAVTLGAGVRQKLVLAERLNQRQELRWVAEAGVRRAQSELLKKNSDLEFDTRRDAWFDEEPLYGRIPVGQGVFSLIHGEEDLSATLYGFRDEESKINLNTADVQTIKRLFEALGICEAQELANAIVDWKDVDPVALSPGGAEDDHYEWMSQPYSAKDASFDLVDELRLVRGVTDQLFRRIMDYVTVYGSGAVNINTAPRAVLLALGIRADLVEKMLLYRAGKDEVDLTADDRSFVTLSAIAPSLTTEFSLPEADVQELNKVTASGVLGVSSDHFRVFSRARYEGSKKGQWDVLAVLKRIKRPETGYEIRVSYWNEGPNLALNTYQKANMPAGDGEEVACDQCEKKKDRGARND